MTSGAQPAVCKPPAPESTADTAYCADQVRTHARGRYLASLFAPADKRPALLGLYAFDHEISRVRGLVREPMAGLIRFQWWRDAIEAIAAGRPAPAHPVARVLQRAWGDLAPSRERLEAAIDGRERELEHDPPATMAALEQHLEATSAGLVMAASAVLGVRDEQSLDTARRVGLAIGLADIVREIDVDRRRVLFLPGEMLRRHRITDQVVEEAESPRVFAPVIRDLADHVRAHLRQARRSRRTLAREALPAVLPGIMVRHQLKVGALGARVRSAPLAPLRMVVCRALGIF